MYSEIIDGPQGGVSSDHPDVRSVGSAAKTVCCLRESLCGVHLQSEKDRDCSQSTVTSNPTK